MSKDRNKQKKLKRKQNQEESLKMDNINFDIISLLKENQFETKPEIGNFIKQYIKDIRIMVDYGKIMLYPVMQYSISKVFIDFLDGHQIISDFKRQPREYYLWKGLDEIQLKERDIHYIINFVQKLQEFQFIK